MRRAFDGLRNTKYEITFDPKTMTFKEKLIWTIRLWAGFKQPLKCKAEEKEVPDTDAYLAYKERVPFLI